MSINVSGLVPKLAFNYIKQVENYYMQHKSFSDEILQNLHALFGNVFVTACELLSKCTIIRYQIQDKSRQVYKITTYEEQYTVYNNINFCHCQYFRYQVMDLGNCITCKHVLAVILSGIQGKVKEETITDFQFVDFLNEQINFVEFSNNSTNDT